MDTGIYVVNEYNKSYMELQLKSRSPKLHITKIGFLQFLLKLIVSNVLIQPHHIQIMIFATTTVSVIV